MFRGRLREARPSNAQADRPADPRPSCARVERVRGHAWTLRSGEVGKFMRNFARKLGGGGARTAAPHVRARQGLGVVEVVVVKLGNRLEGGGRGGWF